MRVLTVQQPWAWAIIHGGKNVENRSTRWKYRGPLAIHAGQRFDSGAVSGNRTLAASVLADVITNPAPNRDIRGAIIGVVYLDGVHKATPDCVSKGGPCHDWGWFCWETPKGVRTVVHLVLGDPQLLTHPIPTKGRLGLWKPDSELLAAIVGAIPHAA